MIIYLFLFLVALGSVNLLTPLSMKLAEKIGAVDIPTDRKVHKTPIPGWRCSSHSFRGHFAFAGGRCQRLHSQGC